MSRIVQQRPHLPFSLTRPGRWFGRLPCLFGLHSAVRSFGFCPRCWTFLGV